MKALVLLNMGGARSKDELELFLRNMFNDKNILTIKSNFLRSIIASFIVNSRKNSAWENYEKIGGKSPIYDFTDKLVNKLKNKFEDEYYITYTMRYTPPFANETVLELKEKGIKEIVLLPLYPQYSTTTTKSSVEDFIEACNNDFNIEVIDPYYNNISYNKNIVNEIKRYVGDNEDYNLIFSAHGLPQKIVDKGDPYEMNLQEQMIILRDLFYQENIKFESINLAYQSKVGPLKWLEPSLDETLKDFENKKVLIYPIAFIIDNSETTFELHIEYEEIAKELGVKEYRVCRCLNDDDGFIETIEELLRG